MARKKDFHVSFYVFLFSEYSLSPLQQGTLLAVSTNDNGIKILVKANGHQFLRSFENCTFDAARVSFDTKARVLHL